jgi:hypothetical protein
LNWPKIKIKIFIDYQINFLNYKKMIIKEQTLGLIRHALTFVGGILIAKGLLTESISVDIIGGVMTLIGSIWSVLSKKPEGKVTPDVKP